MERRNREALAEEEARQAALPGARKMQPQAVPENKMLTKTPPSNKIEEVAEPEGLEAVTFASDRARELAEEYELMAIHFRYEAPSGAGGYTAADVRAIAGADQ
jgi:hypothetical protein